MSTQEDNWLWKMEPPSPFSQSIDDADDYNLYYDDKTSSSSSSSSSLGEPTDKVLYDETPSRAQVATKLLEELDEYIKEEPFSDWLEEKVEFLFEDIPSPECGQNKPTIYSVPGKQETTQLLLQEFETVLGDVEACHQIYPSNTSLTPPQTPPPSPPLESEKLSIDTQLLVTLHPLLQIDSANSLTETIAQNSDEPIKTNSSYLQQISGGWNAENISLTLPLANNVASELAEVDEYVRSCAEDMSPSTSSSSNSSYLSEDSNDDPDWTIVKSTPSKLRNQRITKSRNHKPYSRPTIEDKKVRKKEQNKNAATRYRQKKKLEIKEIIGEEQELADYNEKLHDQVKELKREIGYLKGLMRDLFRAKGLIK